MSSPSPDPAGFTPGRPLFLLANDLEIDYPSITAVLLLEGEEAQFSNCYIQGAGAGAGAGAGGTREDDPAGAARSRFITTILRQALGEGGSITLITCDICRQPT